MVSGIFLCETASYSIVEKNDKQSGDEERIKLDVRCGSVEVFVVIEIMVAK